MEDTVNRWRPCVEEGNDCNWGSVGPASRERRMRYLRELIEEYDQRCGEE